jgi:hypothetical protein
MLATIFENIELGKWAVEALDWAIPAIIAPLFIRYILPKLLPVTQHGFDWVEKQAKGVKNQYAQGVLTRMSNLVEAEVLAYENTVIEMLKERAAEGKIKKEELPAILREMKLELLEQVRKKATSQGIWEEAVKVFLGNGSELGSWLSGMVETHVAKLPPSGLQTSKDGITPPAVSEDPVPPSDPK